MMNNKNIATVSNRIIHMKRIMNRIINRMIDKIYNMNRIIKRNIRRTNGAGRVRPSVI